MIKAHRFLRSASVLLTLLLFAACTTPPKKPPQPKPITNQSLPHPRSLDAPAGAVPSGEGAPGSGQGYGTASANAAEVEEEEVAADGTTRLISSSRRAAPAESAAQPANSANAAMEGGTGGGAMPPSSPSTQGGRSDGGGGAKSDPQGRGTAYTDMVGVDLGDEESSTAAGPTDASNAKADRSGNKAGRDDGPGQRPQDSQAAAKAQADTSRLGVRGGKDESGATNGMPPLTSMPSRQREQAPVRENDILAQQLREAAEQEKDPALREKLWVEYRKYKAGL